MQTRKSEVQVKNEVNTANSTDTKAEQAQKKRESIMRKLKKQEKKLAKINAQLANTSREVTSRNVAVGLIEDTKNSESGSTLAQVLNSEEQDVGVGSNETDVIPSHSKVDESAATHDLISKQESTLASVKEVALNSNTEPLETNATAAESPPSNLEGEPDESIPTSSSSATDSDTDISSSTSSSDESPDEESSRQAMPDLVSPPAAEKQTPICRQFLSTGRCGRQTKPGGCRFRHELPRRKTAPDAAGEQKDACPSGKERRKQNGRHRWTGLYQRVWDTIFAPFVCLYAGGFSMDNSGYRADGFECRCWRTIARRTTCWLWRLLSTWWREAYWMVDGWSLACCHVKLT